MYIPEHFRPDDDTVDLLLDGIVAGNLVTSSAEGLDATFVPVVLERARGARGALLLHLARNNDQWSRASSGEALFISDIADGYVSPSWYAAKAEHGRVVPTWNYVTVHVHGRLVVHDDPAWVDDLVRRLTAKHEAERAQPWTVDDAPAAYIAGQLRAIVGVELLITRVEAKVKASQNRSRQDVEGVFAGLDDAGNTDMADWVSRQSANGPRRMAP